MMQSDDLSAKPNVATYVRKGSAANDIKVVASQTLFCDSKLVEIHHGAEIYLLKLTKAGKLILTK